MGQLVSDLKADTEGFIETHISWVFKREEVFTVKRPVNFGFLDFSNLASRERACLSEVELNARLAPGVHLGVVPDSKCRGTVPIGGDGPVVDWAVHMRRLPDSGRADLRLEAGELRWETSRR